MSRSNTLARPAPKDALMWRVVDYLHTNRDEELTRGDVATKFDVEASSVDSLLAPAVDAGFLKRASGGADGVVWRRPQRMRGGPFPTPFTPSLVAAGKAARRAKRSATIVNIGALVIEQGVPISERVSPGSQWTALFDRMKPGDSFQLPAGARDAAAHARSNYKLKVPSAQFLIRKVSETHARVWRTA